MGTFHDHKHVLHGITVVVDTQGDEVFIGRCDDIDDRSVKLLDVDVHRDGDGGISKEDYVRRSAELGFWKRHDRIEVPVESVKKIRRLGDL